MKLCPSCSTSKSESEFYSHSGKRDGLQSTCKACKKAYNAGHYRRNKDAYKASAKRSRKERFERHGITREAYDELLAKSEGLCWICEKSPAVVVDHDHSCCPGEYGCANCVRGVLCNGCNLALGIMCDDPDRLRQAADYLENLNIRV